MAITAESRSLFNEKAQVQKDEISKVLADEKKMLSNLGADPIAVAHSKIALSEKMIYIVTLYVAINDLSVEILGVKNNDALNEARKIIYKALIYLEEVVTSYIDVQFSDIEEQLSAISDISLEKRYFISRKLGLSIRLLVEAFGDNSKWKWSFVELYGRFVTIMKNLMDWKQASKNYFDMESPDYEMTVSYIRIVKKYLDTTAKDYRDKYELSTHSIDDMRVALQYVAASRRLALILDEKEDVEELKKKSQVWKDRLESDRKKGIAT